VIDSDGKNLGVLSTEEAVRNAKARELDLLLIAPNTTPPVAKIVDFNKFLYEEKRKTRAAKSKAKKSEIKELRLTPMTSEGDIARFANRAKEFIEEGNKVKITVKMRGRQMSHPEVAREKLKRVGDLLVEVAKLENEPKLMGGMLSAVFLAK
jgi:translation initiation factor IF-3